MENAKIEYTIRIKDIPEEVKRRIEEINLLHREISKNLEEASDNCSEFYYLKTLEIIKKMRNDIAYSDAVLAESCNILKGYEDFKEGKYTQESFDSNDVQNR